MSTTPENDETRRKTEKEDGTENDSAPHETTNDEDKIEKNVIPQETTVDEDMVEKESVPQETTIRIKRKLPNSSNDNKDVDQELPESIPILDSDAAITISELEDDDVELWLVTVPRHASVRASLPGSKFGFSDLDNGEEKNEQDKKRVGVLKGSYVYREQKAPEKGKMRAAFVIQDENGKPKLQIAKPFARTINVAFDADMDSEDHEAPLKAYPKMPPGLELQYFPIGSKKRKVE